MAYNPQAEEYYKMGQAARSGLGTLSERFKQGQNSIPQLAAVQASRDNAQLTTQASIQAAVARAAATLQAAQMKNQSAEGIARQKNETSTANATAKNETTLKAAQTTADARRASAKGFDPTVQAKNSASAYALTRGKTGAAKDTENKAKELAKSQAGYKPGFMGIGQTQPTPAQYQQAVQQQLGTFAPQMQAPTANPQVLTIQVKALLNAIPDPVTKQQAIENMRAQGIDNDPTAMLQYLQQLLSGQ